MMSTLGAGKGQMVQTMFDLLSIWVVVRGHMKRCQSMDLFSIASVSMFHTNVYACHSSN